MRNLKSWFVCSWNVTLIEFYISSLSWFTGLQNMRRNQNIKRSLRKTKPKIPKGEDGLLHGHQIQHPNQAGNQLQINCL